VKGLTAVESVARRPLFAPGLDSCLLFEGPEGPVLDGFSVRAGAEPMVALHTVRCDPAGCIDVDLGCTPATNTLPIRRLEIPVGGEAGILAAWVRFPDLKVRPLPQRYRRLGPDRYEYSSNTFRAELGVDGNGLVLDYAGAWERVPSDD